MFKQFLRVVLVITSAVTILLWLLFMTDQHNKVMNQDRSNLNNFYIQLGLPLKSTSDLKYKKIVADISKISKLLNIPFLKIASYKGHGLGPKTVDYSKTVDDTVFEVSDLDSSALAKSFKVKLRNGHEYSTKYSKSRVPLVKYGIADFTIKRIDIYKSPQTREGLFYLQTQDITGVRKFRRILSKKLNKDLGVKLTENDFNPSTVPNLDQSGPVNFQQLAITMTFFQLVLIIIYCLSISRDLGIYRLLGYSIVSALKKTTMPLLLLGSGIGVIPALILAIVNKHYELIWPLISLACLVMVVLGLVIFLIAFILNILPTSRLLIKRTYAKATFVVVYVVKGILLTFVLSSALPLGDLMYQSIVANVNDNKSAVYNDYAVFFPTSIGYNQEDLINPQNQSKLLNSVVYPDVNKNGGILIDTIGISGPNSKMKRQYQLVTVNPNYLRFNPLYKSDGTRVRENEVNKRPSILLAKKYRSNLKLQSQIKQYIYKDLKINNPRIIYINNNQSIIDEAGEKVRNYGYIYVRSPKVFDEYGNMFTGNDRDPLKIALHGKTPQEVYKTKYQALFKKYNLTDNYPQLIRASAIQLNVLQQAEGNIMANIISIMITLVTFLVISISLVYLYFSIFGRTYAIKQTLGISIARSSLGLWLLWVIQIILTVIFTFSSSQVSVSGIVLLIFAIGVDFIVSLVGLKIFSKNSIRGLINE